MRTRSFVLSWAYATIATAVTPSFKASIDPAAETVAADSTSANVPLFDNEAIQLTNNVVTELHANPDLAEYAALFVFGDNAKSSMSARARRVRESLRCKTMPGDLLYPNETAWDAFDLLLGGALEKIVPIGSPCYKKSEYNNYNASKCASLVQNVDQEEI